MEEKKLLNINPDLFSLSNNTTRKKPRKQSDGIKMKQLQREQQKEETIRNKAALLRMLRKKQEEKYQAMMEINNSGVAPAPAPSTDKYNNDFEEAKRFMDNLAKKQEITPPKNYTVKQYPNTHTVMPDQIYHPTPLPPIEYVSDFIGREHTPMNLLPPTQSQYQHRPPTAMNMTVKNNPYRQPQYPPQPQLQPQQQQYQQQQQQTSIVPANATHIMEQKINESLKRLDDINQTKSKLEEFKEKMRPKIMKQKKTRKRTYKVGKSRTVPKISVLVSNKTIRKDITTKTQLLKQVPIQDIKKYLMKKGFIKVGSVAPNDVLRKMYESSILICGEIQNHNPENLLYNFMNNDQTHA